MKFIFSYFLLTLLLFGCKAQKNKQLKISDNDNSLLWQVSGNGLKKPSYLFGTFHLLCKGDINFSTQLISSLKSADKIYMELDMDDPSVLVSGLMYMNMNNDKKLKDLYTTAEYQKIVQYFSDTLHTPMMLFQNTKPYFLVALLYPHMMQCAAPSGVEEELVKIAKENKKEIKGLETMEFQASVFDSIPYEWQAKELLKNIDSFSVYKKEFDTMVNIYKNQQLDKMDVLTKSEPGMAAYEDLLVNNRNKNWVNQLKKIMTDESVFVAIGAGHLAGKKGLISLLKSAGYNVQPLINK